MYALKNWIEEYSLVAYRNKEQFTNDCIDKGVSRGMYSLAFGFVWSVVSKAPYVNSIMLSIAYGVTCIATRIFAQSLFFNNNWSKKECMILEIKVLVGSIFLNTITGICLNVFGPVGVAINMIGLYSALNHYEKILCGGEGFP